MTRRRISRIMTGFPQWFANQQGSNRTSRRFPARSWRQGLTVLLALSLMIPVGAPSAHDDKPGPPPIEVKIDFERLFLLDDLDDGIDGNADLVGSIVVTHEGHTGGGSTLQADYDFDLVGTSGLGFKPGLYTHQECSPRSPLIVTVDLVEVDQLSAGEALALLATNLVALRGSLALVLLSGFNPPVAGIIALGAFAVAEMVGLFDSFLLGNDSLGGVSVEAPMNGQFFADLTGGAGRARLRFRATTEPITDNGQCNGPPEMPPPPTEEEIEEKTSMLYESLKEGVGKAFDVAQTEAGNPAGLTPLQTVAIRDSVVSGLTGLAEGLAGTAIETANRVVENPQADLQQAVNSFSEGQSLIQSGREFGNAGFLGQAIDFFLNAFIKATREIEISNCRNGADGGFTVASPAQAVLPFQVILTPDIFTTTTGSNPEFVTLVLGAEDQLDDVTISSRLPQGIEAEIERVSEAEGVSLDFPVFKIKLNIGDDVRRRSHLLEVTARKGRQRASKVLTLIVN